ncbi:MAG: hypothetical protein HY927_12590 [Elusimicrobia bacterium]|nr:hypothetical protein [Elusimicrobiota bacterium]
MSGTRLRLWAGPAFLAVAAAIVLGPHVPWAGLHLDDHPFHWGLSRCDAGAMWAQFRQYVPGRNLHILYTWLLYKLLGPSPVAMHLFGLALDTLNACLAWSLARRFGAGLGGALMVSGLFLVFPNHGETHFWTSAIVMNLLSTTLVLGAALAACSGRAVAALALFGLALFDYDQVFLMWVPLLLCLDFHPADAPERRRRGVQAGWPAVPGALGGGVGGRRGAVFVAAAVALCVIHVALRHGSPAGSNPTVRLGSIALRAAQAAAGSLLPMVKLPRWETLHSAAGGPAATAALAAALGALWVWAVGRLWPDGGERPSRLLPASSGGGMSAPGTPGASRPLVRFGAAWWLAAYFPNLFWFISSRHHYLPSFGLLLLLYAGVARLLERRPRAAGALAAAGFIFFSLSSALALGQGWSWKTSWSLMERFADQAPPLAGPSPASLFVHGAPLRVGYAPAFPLTSEHLVAFGYRTGRQPGAGAVTLAPTRTGLFSLNYPELFGDSYFDWLPLASASVLVYGPQGALDCGRALDLDLPDSRSLRLALASRPGCSAVPRLWVPVWLESSRRTRRVGHPLSAIPGGPALHSAAVESGLGMLRLRLLWSGTPGGDFAFIARLYDRAGRLLFRPVYRERPRDPSSAQLLWPLFNDLVPGSTWKKGDGVSEVYQLRLESPLPHGPGEARFEVFERSASGAWPRIGEVRAAVDL